MHQPSNLSIVRSMYAAFAKGDVAALLDSCHPEIVWQVVGNPEQAPFFGRHDGHAGVIEFLQQLSAALTDIVNTPENIYDVDDKVIVTGHDSAKARATGKSLSTEWVHLFTLEQGKVREFKEFYDTARIVAALERQS